MNNKYRYLVFLYFFHFSVQKCIYIKLTNYLHFLLYFLIYIIYNISHIIFFKNITIKNYMFLKNIICEILYMI